MGANGVFYRFGDKTGHVAGVPCKVGDTNGAGDTFFGAALSKLCKEEPDILTVDKLEGILAFANKAASISPPAATVRSLPCLHWKKSKNNRTGHQPVANHTDWWPETMG